MPKIVQLVHSCGECPDYRYYSGGNYECGLTGQIVHDKASIAPFCPLADFPARIIADMDMTIRVLREPNSHGLVLAILSHVATKLKTVLSASGTMDILLKDGSHVYLSHDYITGIAIYPWAIHFATEGKKFKLIPDTNPPELYEEVVVAGHEEPLYTRCELA